MRLKYVLILGIIALILADIMAFFDLKKFIKLHENELIENNIKGLMLRCTIIMVITLVVGIMGIVIQFIVSK